MTSASASGAAERPHSAPTGRTLLAGVLVLLALPAQALEVPYLTGRVNDLAGLLSPATSTRLEERLARLEQETGAQVAVLTIASLEGESLELFSLQVAETWQLGQESVDNGVLLLIARDDRKMRLEVGYGLEPVLTDAVCGRILDHAVRPRFRQGDFDGGVEAGLAAVEEAIRTGDVRSLPARPAAGPVDADRIVPALVWTVVALLIHGWAGMVLLFFAAPAIYGLAAALFGPVGGLIGAVVWIVAILLLRRLSKRARGGDGGSWWSSSGGWGSGGSIGGGFSGGFSGGGGSFGGGGASSSW